VRKARVTAWGPREAAVGVGREVGLVLELWGLAEQVRLRPALAAGQIGRLALPPQLPPNTVKTVVFLFCFCFCHPRLCVCVVCVKTVFREFLSPKKES
jgi:hypothetical protein